MAKEESSEARVIEERVELMVDHTSSKVIQNPTKRIAHFLNPSLNLNALSPPLPKIQSFSSSSTPTAVFFCYSTPLKGWKTWVEKLGETHEATWRKAGIFDAIKGSTYHIARVSDLIFSLGEKWCPETNTFVFPWGEATVTLEDVYVLGGFSPLGVSVSSGGSSLEENVEQVENKLIKLYGKLKGKNNHLTQLRWQEYFMGCGNQLEYAAFLALWLSRHVFPGKSTVIVHKAVFSMAARLSCGAKLAFGPAILASIYRDLTLLKRKIVGSLNGCAVKLTSPLHLVQVWACERFPSLGPVPRMINCGETRLARWVSHARKLYDGIDGIGMCLDSSRQTFRWRPYTMSVANWSLPRFYVDAGKWVDAASHEDWKLFSRCLLVGQLFGLNCVEEYNPHRVALQFGFDQDIPESIDRSKASCKLGWLGYKKNLRGLKLHIPPRLHEGDVTRRYFDWWRAGPHSEEEVQVGCKRKKRPRKRCKKISKICDRSSEFDARENQMEKSPSREESSSRNVLQVCNHTRMTCVFHMKVASISQEDPSTEEDEVVQVRFSDHSMGGCSTHNEVEESVINILCSKLAETELNTPCMEAVGSDFTVKHQNLANEVGKVRPEAGSKNCEVNVRDQNEEHNVVEHHVNTELKASGSLLAEDEPAVTLCEDKDPMNQADIPVGGQLAVSNDDNPFLALCVQYESRISRLEREISAL